SIAIMLGYTYRDRYWLSRTHSDVPAAAAYRTAAATAQPAATMTRSRRAAAQASPTSAKANAAPTRVGCTSEANAKGVSRRQAVGHSATATTPVCVCGAEDKSRKTNPAAPPTAVSTMDRSTDSRDRSSVNGARKSTTPALTQCASTMSGTLTTVAMALPPPTRISAASPSARLTP